MIHHHSSGKRGLWKRIFSMCIALVLICGVTVPASVSASGSVDGADGVPAPETTYNFYLDGKEYASQTVKDGETLSEPETPTAEGKTFDAWYTEMEGGEKFTDFSVQTVTETKAVFLYGRWQEADTADTENPEASEDTEIPESPETPEPGDPQEPGEGEPGQQPNQEIENGETNTENQQPGTPETDEDGNTDSESDEDETAYEQRAMAVLALYGEEAAFRADENIDLSYFEIYVDGSLYDNEVTGTVETGPISGESVPSIIGYEFIVATIDGIKVESVGTLTYENQEYVYYTTEGSATSLAAMVLEEGKTIRLNYETPKEEYSIGYTVTGGGYSADNIFNAERPVTVTGGESYAFRVNIPRGYSATVLVNEQTVGTLGTEPTYKRNGNLIEVAENSPAEVLTLTGTYEIENVNSDQNVEVQLQQRNTYTFNAQLWTETDYAKGRADFGEPTRNFSGADEGKKTQIWKFKTNNSSNVNWVLDSLQINGTKLEIPYGDYKSLWPWQDYPAVSKTTELPSGTSVTVTLTNVERNGSKYTRTYTVSVSNCYENITITGGNLVNSNWPEIIPKTLTGVEVFRVKNQHQADEGTGEKIVSQSEPFSVGNRGENNKNYWFGEDLQFKLLPGYVNPQVIYTTTDGTSLDGFLSFNEEQKPDADGWYTFQISRNGDNTITMLEITAEVGQYRVTYDDGTETAETLPTDETVYSIVGEDQIIISSQIPTDTGNQATFEYWTLEGYVDDNDDLIQISPNALLNLEDIAEYAVEGSDGIYELPLKAHWISNEEAEQITYRIEFILVDENNSETTIQKGNYQAVKGTAIILDTEAAEVKEFLADHPGYVLDEEKTVRYNPDIQPGTVLKVYFKKNVTDVTVTKLVTGKLGDLNKEFAFTWSYTYGEVEKSGGLNDLSHNEFDVIKGIPVGATLTLTETGAAGYTTTAEHNNSPVTVTNSEAGKTVTITVVGQDQITVTNDKDADPDTGIHLTTWPYVMTLAFVGAGAATFGLYKSKRRDS